MMKELSKNQKGFGAVEAVLIVVIIALIGVAGWIVYKHDHKTTSASTLTSSSKMTQTNQPTDPTAGWASYSSSTGGFSFKYPKDWATTASAVGCPSGLLMLGANSSSVGKCGTNNFGQMTVTWQPAKAQCGLNASDWTINFTTDVTVSGVSGLETEATSKATTTSGPAGTKTVQYCFITKGNMYVADYTELSSYPNVLSDFNTMVTKTLTLAPPITTDVLLQRTQYIDAYDSQEISKATPVKDLYSALDTQGYITGTFTTKLDTYATDFDGLECVAAGIIPRQTYAPANISGSSATLIKTEVYNNPNPQSSTTQSVTYAWTNENGAWKLSGVTCQY